MTDYPMLHTDRDRIAAQPDADLLADALGLR